MNDKEQEQQRKLTDKLKELPEIYDKRSKEEIYSQISSRVKYDKNSPRRKNWLPMISASAAALLIFILIPAVLNMDMQQTSEDDAVHQTSDIQMEEANESQAYQYTEESSRQNTNDEDVPAEQENTLAKDEKESLIVQDINQDENIYFAGLSDIQEQYVIPISFINSGERDLQSFYNELGKYIRELNIHSGEYLFENVEFNINEPKDEVSLVLPNNYSFEGSTARANMFEYILSIMFRPYGTEKVTIHSDEGEPAELEPFGIIDEMPIREMTPSSYKLYELGNTRKLIQIPHDQQTSIEEAIQEMKKDETEYHVYRSIPDDIDFSINQEDNQLSIRLAENANLAEDERSLEMVEAVLMTAKSYGFEKVKFDNTNQEQLGPYNLTAPVSVPEAVNPIYLDN
ncbi:hypothetical protein [Virgibacillus kimchii]